MIVFDKTWALDFSGGSLAVPDHPDFALSHALTWAAWVRPGTFVNQGTLLSKGYQAYELQVQHQRFKLERGPEYPTSAGRPIGAGAWLHLAATFDATLPRENIRLYVNGELDSVHDAPTPLAQTGDAVRIGIRPGGGEDLVFRGQVAEMALWNAPLSAWRIRQEMNSRPDASAPELVAYWDMSEGAGTVVGDRSARAHAAAIDGAVTWTRLDAPITIPTPGSGVPWSAQQDPGPPLAAGTEPALHAAADDTPLHARAPRVPLPPSGRGGQAHDFLGRASLAARQQVAAAGSANATRLQRARDAAADHVAAAHADAARQVNTTRFDAIWYLRNRQVHRVDAQGRDTLFRTRYIQSLESSLVAAGMAGPPLSMMLVDARAGWASTGMQAAPGVRLRLDAGGSRWTVSPDDRDLTAAGTTRFAAPEGYALAGGAPGALVGRVGDTVFPVGMGADVPAGVEGELFLAANDDVSGRYGAGYADNSGTMEVQIQAMQLYPTAASALAVDAARGLVFWAFPHPRFALCVAAADGSGGERTVWTGDTPVEALALDEVNERVFFFAAGRLMRVPYAGGEAQQVLDARGPGEHQAWDLAVDDDNARVYWTGPGGVWRASLDGAQATLVVPPHAAPAPVGVAVDGEAGALYWLDAVLGRLCRAALDGSAPADLYAVDDPVPGLTLDRVSSDTGLVQEVYWSARERGITRQTPGIAVHWPLDEGEGRTVINRVRPALHSNLGAFRRAGGDLPPALHPPALAVDLRGGTDGMRLGADIGDRLLDASWTVELWVKPRSLPADGESSLLSMGESAPNRALHLSLLNGRANLGFSSNDTVGTVPVRAGEWTHLAFRYDRARQEQAVFINGVLDTASAGHGPLQGTPGGALYAGVCMLGTPRAFDGLMAGLHLAARALSAAEIAASVADGKGTDLLAGVADDPAWLAEDAPPVLRQPAWVLAFGGAGHVKLGSARVLGITGGSFTAECWVRPDGVEDVAVLGTDETAAGAALRMGIRGGVAVLGFGGDEGVAGRTPLRAGEWTHLAWRYDAATGEQAVLVNGVVDGSRKAPAGFSGQGMVYLGRAQGAWRLAGAVSELRVWSVARTDDELLRNHRGFREQFALRAPVDGSAEPEHLFEIRSEGSLALVSRESADHERRLLAYRARQEAQARAAAQAAAAHAEAQARIAARNADLARTHGETAAAVAAQTAAHEQARTDNRTRLAAAHSTASARLEGARQDAAGKRATGRAQAAEVTGGAQATAATLKRNAQSERDRARAARDGAG